VICEAGGSELLKVESRPIPTPRVGEVLMRARDRETKAQAESEIGPVLARDRSRSGPCGQVITKSLSANPRASPLGPGSEILSGRRDR
jgi:hypothetical protein